jgi:hypothetical protein
LAEVNAKAEIRADHALIYLDSADSRSIEWDLAATAVRGFIAASGRLSPAVMENWPLSRLFKG